MPFEVVAPPTLPATEATPVFAVIERVLLSTLPMFTVRLPLSLTVVKPTTLAPDWIVASVVPLRVRLSDNVPLVTRFALLFRVVTPPTVPDTTRTELSPAVSEPVIRPPTVRCAALLIVALPERFPED